MPTYLDFDRERDLDSERLAARVGLGVPDLLSDLTRAGLPRSDLDGERDPYCHSSMLTTFSWTHTFISLYRKIIVVCWAHTVHLSKMHSLYTVEERVSNLITSIHQSLVYSVAVIKHTSQKYMTGLFPCPPGPSREKIKTCIFMLHKREHGKEKTCVT